MDSNSWPLLLSLLGLGLGFISAYGQIKGFFQRLLRRSSVSIAAWTKEQKERIDAMATHPSVLVAYLARSVMYIFTIVFALFMIPHFLRNFGAVPTWLVKAISLTGGSLIGLELGTLHPTVIEVSKRALVLAKAAKSST